jgi:hypothetical protein
MRGLLVGITGLLGAAAFWRRRRHKQAGELSGFGEADPAEELRATLAASRASGGAVVTDDPAAAPVADAGASPLDPEARRKSLHDRARASIDELK